MTFIKDYARTNGTSSAIDYVVTQKKEGKYLSGQILIYLFIAVAVIAVFAVMVTFIGTAMGMMAGIGLAVPVFWITYYGTRTICNFDRKYSIFTTNVTMDQTPTTVISFEIIKDKKKKDEDTRYVVYERAMKEADLFAPYTDQYKDKLQGANVIDFRSSVNKNDDIYFALFTEADGSKTAILFEAVNKVVDKLAYYNKEATIVEKLSR